MSSVIRRKGRRGRRPLRWSRVGRFQRSREVQFTTPVTLYAASSVTLSPVGCTVLGAPWLRDCRGNVGADGRRARQHPRYLRCAHLASITQRIQSRGHSPRTIFYGRTHVIRPPTPGGRGSPPLRCVGKASASHSRRPQPLSHGAKRRDSSPFRGADRAGCGAPTLCLSPRVARNPSVTARSAATAPLSGEPIGRGVAHRRCASHPASPATPQSRREAPRQLPFQGS